MVRKLKDDAKIRYTWILFTEARVHLVIYEI